ncbi:MAG TPA: hypothetical protein VKV21_15300 [Solirubrobacteraceae bacterium]|nr:hypothetical protein [Solirubrobacteraceae bacterium]
MSAVWIAIGAYLGAMTVALVWSSALGRVAKEADERERRGPRALALPSAPEATGPVGGAVGARPARHAASGPVAQSAARPRHRPAGAPVRRRGAGSAACELRAAPAEPGSFTQE